MPFPMATSRPVPTRVIATTPFGRTPIFALLVIVGGATLAYWNSFSVPFVFDDELSILANPTIRSLGQAWWPPQDNGGLTVAGRPLLNFSLGINYAISGTEVWSYHALNLLIHVTAGLLLFGLVRRTLARPALAQKFGASAFELALVTAALWTLHPLQTESVTYIIQRAESLVSLMYLLTLWCFVRSLEPKASPWWTHGTFVACLLGMLAKEVMVSAPLLVLLYDRTFVAGSWREVWTRRRRIHFLMAGTWLVLFALVWPNLDRGGSAGFAMPTTVFAYARSQIYAIAHYLWLTVWPAPLILDYGTATVERWGEILWPAAVLFPLGGATLWAAWRVRPLGYCGIFFFAVLAPSSSFVPISQTLAEHRMYLPLAAVLVVATTGACSVLGRKGLMGLGAVAVAFGITTALRNQDYATQIRLYEDTVAKRPGNARAMALLADYYRRDGRLDEARHWLERSLAVEPGVPQVLNNLGDVWQSLGAPAKAVPCFQAALARSPHDIALMNNLGNALVLSGQTAQGIAQLEAALQMAPSSGKTRSNLANSLAQCGRFAEAAVHFELLLKAQPDDAETHNAYSKVLQELGRKTEALAHLQEAVRLQPDNADWHNRLGSALGRAGRLREALMHFEETLRLDPTHDSARQNAARARQLLGDR